MSDASRDLRQCAYGVGQSYPVTADVCRRAADYIEKLEQQLAELREALEKLARLGNGDRYGNSEGNVIAQNALALQERNNVL